MSEPVTTVTEMKWGDIFLNRSAQHKKLSPFSFIVVATHLTALLLFYIDTQPTKP